ncbi:MAG TPA: glycosyltransferase family A protein [Pyrinomonadaceae bacterium]|nr:glycosyltransferase family A protein [Pyrinomonadaceae bacterium]
MPVHNTRAFLDQSIASILNQTLTSFELVILDDASTDGSSDVAQNWARQDSRIVLHHSKHQLGPVGSSNFVVSRSTAAIIARMDADDVAHPERLKRQHDIISEQADVVAVGTLSEGIDSNGRLVRPRDRWRLVRRSAFTPFPHGSVMFRREAFDRIGGYRHDSPHGEDQDLFRRMSLVGRIVTLPEVLYSYRYHLTNATYSIYARDEKSNGSYDSQNVVATLYSLGAMRLWAGYSPDILGEMLAEKSLRLDAATLKTLTWASWGSLSPGSLRYFLRTMIRARDLVLGLHIKNGRPYEWRSE